MSCPQIPLSPRRQFEPLVRRAGETGRPAWKLVCFGTHNRLWKHYFVCVCVCACACVGGGHACEGGHSGGCRGAFGVWFSLLGVEVESFSSWAVVCRQQGYLREVGRCGELQYGGLLAPARGHPSCSKGQQGPEELQAPRPAEARGEPLPACRTTATPLPCPSPALPGKWPSPRLPGLSTGPWENPSHAPPLPSTPTPQTHQPC